MDDARKRLVEQIRIQRSRFEKLKPAKTQHNQTQQSPTPPGVDSTQVLRETRLDTLGPAPWGAHFCLLYESEQDLIDVLVPYFKAGLENNELCVWITGPLSRKEAREALKRTVPDFKEFQRKRQIEIITHADWYLKDNTFNPKIVLEKWVQKLNHARTKGFTGIRVTGDGSVFEEQDLRALAEYEKQVNQTICNSRIISICTYQSDKYSAVGLVEVVSNHQSAIVKRQGKWEVVENTGRKEAQEALRESEEKYRQVVSTTIDAAMLFDPETRKFIEVNPACEKLYGYTREEFLNLRQTDITAEPQKSDESIKKTAKGKPHKIDLRYHRKKDGIIFPVEISASTFKLGAKTVVCCVIRDITERIHAQEALNNEHNLLRTLVDNLPDAVYIKDTKGRFLLGNAELARRFNLENTQDFTGKTDYDFFDKEQADICYEAEQKVMKSGKPLLYKEQ